MRGDCQSKPSGAARSLGCTDHKLPRDKNKMLRFKVSLRISFRSPRSPPIHKAPIKGDEGTNYQKIKYKCSWLAVSAWLSSIKTLEEQSVVKCSDARTRRLCLGGRSSPAARTVLQPPHPSQRGFAPAVKIQRVEGSVCTFQAGGFHGSCLL